MSPPSPRSPRRLAGRWAVAALLLVILAPAGRAQTPDCPDAFAEAETMYRDGQFEGVEARLRPCLEAPAVETPVRRLLALAFLRQQRLADAQDVVTQLLADDPTYTADPVQDPPVYVSLVALVAEARRSAPTVLDPTASQPVTLGEAGPVPARPDAGGASRRLDVRTYPARFRSPGTITLGASVGMESYDGERRRVGDGLFGGFVRNGGLSGVLSVEARFRPWLAGDLRLGAMHLPHLIRDGLADSESGYEVPPGGQLGFPVTSYETLDPDATGRTVTSVAASLRADVLPGGLVSPYVRGGARLTLRRINDGLRVGVGPEGALGVEALTSRRAAVFGEVSGTLVTDRGLDAAVYRANGDLLIGLRFGLRLLLASGPQ